MTNKKVEDVLHKFYMSIEDADDDKNCVFIGVAVENGIQPNEERILVDNFFEKIVKEEDKSKESIDFCMGIFKLKNMKRETLFGTFHEKVYIFNCYDYEEYNGN